MLLRFRVANHRSIREEQELSLVAVPKRGEAKPKAHEIPPTVHVAGIYGPTPRENLMCWMPCGG